METSKLRFQKKLGYHTWTDTLFWYCMVFGALGAIVSCLPPVSWRWSRMNPHLGDRFVADRWIGLFTTSNQFSTPVIWFKMKSSMCRFSDDLHAPNASNIHEGHQSMKAMELRLAKENKQNSTKGGTWLGCFSWQECKQATMARCTNYGKLAGAGVFAGLLMYVAAISAGMGLVCIAKESFAKKKEEIFAAEWHTCLCGIVAFLTCSFAVVIWICVTKVYFDSLRNMMYYPYPYITTGSFVGGGSAFLLFWGALLGWRRQSYLNERDYSKKIRVHIGPLVVGSDGMVAKPKFNFGIEGGTIYAMAGVRDIRDGLKVEASSMIMKTYHTEGDSLVDMLHNVKAEEDILSREGSWVEHIKIIDQLITTIPDIIATVLELLKVDINVNSLKAEGCVYIYTGVGVSAGAYFGWLDTNGYRMVGASGMVAAVASLAFAVKAGIHESRTLVRISAFLSNVGIDAIVTLKEPVPAEN